MLQPLEVGHVLRLAQQWLVGGEVVRVQAVPVPDAKQDLSHHVSDVIDLGVTAS